MFDSRWLRVARSVGAGSEFPVGEQEPEGLGEDIVAEALLRSQ